MEFNVNRGRAIAEILGKHFKDKDLNLSEATPPTGVTEGSLEHLLFVTLTVSIDYQRDAKTLWGNARKTFEDEETRYLFHPESVYKTPIGKIIADMQKYKLSKKTKKDATIWKTVATTFYTKWDGNPMNFLHNCDWDALEVLKRLKNDKHSSNGKTVHDFPYLRGNKIGPLWLRILAYIVGINRLKNLNKVPIPVDTHVARATFYLGIIKGNYKGQMSSLYEDIRKVWFNCVNGVLIKGREMIPLDLDEPLWNLSRKGCSHVTPDGNCPQQDTCIVKEFCVRQTVKIEHGFLELNC